MNIVSLLPADTYTVVNKSIITEDDKKKIIENLSKLGKFKITKEEASSSGVRRIKAILE